MALRSENYRQMIRRLLPSGLAWRDDAETTENTLDVIAQEPARIDARTDELIDEIDPRTTNELLLDWERVCGLPDACGYTPESTEARRAAVVSRLTALGGATPQYFIDLAAFHGYEITITEFTQFEAGASAAGDAVNDIVWLHWWQVNALLDTVFEFKASRSVADDPLRDWGNENLECLLRSYKPGHTQILFTYS